MTKVQNNYHPELLENWAVWKSYNQEIKEVTFIQTSGKSRDAETQRCGDLEWAVPQPHVMHKNWKKYLSSEGSQTHTRPPTPGF